MGGRAAEEASLAGRLSIALAKARPRLKRRQLAAKLGVSAAAISHWLNGMRECPRERVHEIAKITKADPGWLLLGDDAASTMATPTPRVREERTPRPATKGSARRLTWGFREAPPDGGKDFGNAGVYATPMSVKTVVREDGQNSLDAGLGGPVVMRFRVVELEPSSDRYGRLLNALAFDELAEHIAAVGAQSKIGARLAAGLEHLREDKLVAVIVDDYGTSGLVGGEFDSDGPYCALVRDNLNSAKGSATAGGVFGLGAKVNLACSRVGTVLFASKVHGEEVRGTRLVARSELTYHELGRGRERTRFAGPGWFGKMGKGEVVESAWLPDDHRILDDLLLRRDDLPRGVTAKRSTGTSILILAFWDPQVDLSAGTKQLVDQIVEAVAVNFWPAIMRDQLAVWVERHTGDVDKPVTSELVDPRAIVGVTPFCDALEKHSMREERPTLAEAGDVVSVPITLTVPATRPRATSVTPHDEVQSECRLVVRLASAEAEGSDPRLNDVAYVRGRAMVTRYQAKGNVLLGARPFHAALLAGTLVGRSREQTAAEEFLRLAEPPAHDRWAYNADVADKFARGAKRLLDEFFNRVTEQLQRVLRPIASGTHDGPEVLSKLLQLRSFAPPRPNQGRAAILSASGHIVDGAWVVEAEVSIDPVAAPLRLVPRLSFEREGSAAVRVRWRHLEVLTGTVEPNDGGFLAKPRTKRFGFRGVSDPASHPVGALESAVLLDVHASTGA